MRRRAVTIVELLVVVAVLAILLGILLPTLRGAFFRAREVNDLVNLRSTHQQFFQWGVAHRDRFVNRGLPVPGEPYIFRIGNDTQNFIAGAYAGQTSFWTWTLGEWLERGYPSWHPIDTQPLQPHEQQMFARLVPLPGSDHFRPSDFLMSSAMLFDPRRFMPGCMDDPNPHARFVRWSETAYPANKVLLYNNAALDSPTGAYPVEDPSVALALVDGSARYASPHDAITIPGEICSGDPIRQTPLGILGRDFP
jgi:hypothetical protein